MSKSFEALPEFYSKIETATFLRALADDIEQGKLALVDAQMTKYYEYHRKGIKVVIETTEASSNYMLYPPNIYADTR